MSFNLIKTIQDQFNQSNIDVISKFIGGSSGSTKSAIDALLPKVINGMADKASTRSGSDALMGLINDNNKGNILSNIGDFLDGGLKTNDLLQRGKSIASGLFGNNLSKLSSSVSQSSGLAQGGMSKLINILGPAIMGIVGKHMLTNKLGASALPSFLNEQKAYFSSSADKAKVTSNEVHRTNQNSSGGGGWWKWLLGALLTILLLGWLFKNGCNDPEIKQDTTELASDIKKSSASKNNTGGQTSNTSSQSSETRSISGSTSTEAEATNEAGSVSMNYTLDPEGDLIDSKGVVVYKEGTFKIVDGNYVDANGKKIGLIPKIGKAIGGAAVKTKDAFVGLFSKMLKKEEGAKSTYLLNDIVFDPENHRITSFSKAEVEGLAAALKTLPDSKIEVTQYSMDGDELSKKRATVIKDMLVTLGVSEKQISAKGMGDKDKSKATQEKVEIVVK